ncbi:hypothetical protein GGF37_001298 [Kickxella alabastrina]|nr:hypothetical protein GGF37_001298 [Kickxella alabastrina]
MSQPLVVKTHYSDDSDDSMMGLDDPQHDATLRARRDKVRGGQQRDRYSDDGSSDEDIESEAEDQPLFTRKHRWQSHPPLLPQHMARLVSTVSSATRLSLDITALCWGAIFDTISEGARSGLMLGTTAWEEASAISMVIAEIFSPLSSLNPRIISRLVNMTTAAGYSAVNKSLTTVESLLEGGFTMYTTAINTGLHVASEYVRIIGALFGSTETSGVLTSFIKMCRHELMDKNPEIRALIKKQGVLGFTAHLLKTIVAWICLQVVTRGRLRSYRMHLVYTNVDSPSALCIRRYIDSNGRPIPEASVTPKADTARMPQDITSISGTPLEISPKVQAADIIVSDEKSSAPTNGTSAGHGQSPVLLSNVRSATFSSRNRDLDFCNDDDSAYYAFSDQEVSHRDPEWDRQLAEALRDLKFQSVRRKYHADDDEQSDNVPEMNGNTESEDASDSQQSAKPSLWNNLAFVRQAAAAAAAAGSPSAKAHASNASTTTSDNSGDSDSQISSVMSSMLHHGDRYPAFESAPASLISSPQFSHSFGIALADHMHRSTTIADGESFDSQNTEATKKIIGHLQLPQPQGPAAFLNIPPLTSILPIITDDMPDPMAVDGAKWVQQDFPRKPLAINLARFIPIASSAYGKTFMQVLGLTRNLIDSRALVEDFGDFGIDETDKASRKVSLSDSLSSMEQAISGSHTPLSARHSRNPSFSKLPRAQPMSSYHTHSAYNSSRPNSQRHYERRHFKSPRSETPSGKWTSGRRPPVRRLHSRSRPVSDHPNHYFFSQHTGIPLSDLLFSSYVSPVLPGVTRAASAKASAVERELRHKHSNGSLGLSKNKLKKGKKNVKQPETDLSAPLDSERLPTNTQAEKSRGWLASIPVVGSVYQSLPSPTSALLSIPIIPGMVSRIIGSGNQPDAKPAESADPKSMQREPTLSQFRRFDQIRQRLVYREPSAHALVHYIAVDHSSRAVVLACRGTLGLSDIIVDMICEYESVRLPGHPATKGQQEFIVHSGMWHSAMMLADASSEVFKEVAEALRLYPEYGLVLTGHSLGGGVASLLTLLWSQPLFDHKNLVLQNSDTPQTPGSTVGSGRQFATTEKFGLVTPRPIHCFSFGSPCSTNAALSHYCRGLVTSVANADDFITFLSIGSCLDILNISAVLGHESGVAEKIVRRFLSAQRDKISRRFNPFDFDFSKLRAYSPSDDEDDYSDAVDDNKDGGVPENARVEDSKSTGGGFWWGSRKTTVRDNSDPKQQQQKSQGSDAASANSNASSASRPSKRPKKSADSKAQSKNDLDDWHWSLVKTLRANMDSDKLYPPGDVFILASPGDDKVCDKHMRPDAGSEPLRAKAVPAGTVEQPGDGSGNKAAKDKSRGSAQDVGLFYCPDVVERFSELRFTRNMLMHHSPKTYESKIAALIHGSS